MLDYEYKFKSKYNTETTRLQSWDYSDSWFYYITIYTKDRQNFFGEIKDWKMFLNDIWEIAKKYWLEIPNHFDNCKLDEFIIIPNHIHGILIIGDNGSNNTRENIEQNIREDIEQNTRQCLVSTVKIILKI